MKKRLIGVLVALGIVAGVTLAPAAANAAAPAPAKAAASVSLGSTSWWPPTTPSGWGSTTGKTIWSSDGTVPTDPKHDPSIAVIPFCNPLKLISWLKQNFSDHGRDILTAIASGKFLSLLLAIPQYAYNDAKFHIPATIVNLGGCLQFKPSS